MARPFPLPCDTDMKWVFKAGFNIDPATLAKNLTILCTVAFSGTVLYVMYSNSKRPQYTHNNIQISFSDDEESSDEDHTTQCKTRCRHSIVGNSDRSRPPDRLMSFGIPLDDVESPSSRAYCHLDSTVDVNMAKDGLGDESLTSSETLNVQIQPSTASSVTSDPNATNDGDTSAGRQDDNSLKTCAIDNAETQAMPSIMASVLNSSSDVSMAAEAFVDGTLSSIESLFTQVQPSTISTASGPDAIETCTETQPQTTSTASGPGVTAASRLDDTRLCSGFTKENAHFHYDPECTSAKVGLLRHFKEGESPNRRSREELDVIDEDGAENLHSMEKNDDGASHFEGYICGIIREKGSKSYKYGGVSFAREQGDGGCSREKIDLGGKVSIRFQEACTQLEGGEVCDDISIRRPHKIVEGIRKKNFDIVSFQEGCANTLSRDYRPRHRDSCTQTEVKDQGTSISVDSFSASSSREACTGQPLKQLHTMKKDETRHLPSNNFECRDKGTGKFVYTFSASSTRGAFTERPLKQLSTMAKEETRHLLGNNFEECRDRGTSTSVDTFPASRTRGARTGRPFKQTRTMPKEETRHSINNNFGVVERSAEERRECGITSVQSEPVAPLEQTKCSVKTLTETQHWSKMSLPEQYEYLELLDSTLAAASAEWKGKRNVTYWRHKDSAPPSKLSGLSSLCKPQGESEYSSRFTPGHIEVPAPKTSSPACPNVDRAHLHFQEDANCTNIPSSSSRQVEQFCAEVTCAEAQQILEDKQVHRALSSHPQGNHQPSSTSDSLSYRLPRPTQNNLHDQSKRRAYISAETRRLQSEAARETLTRTKLLAKNSKYHYM